MAGNDSQSCLIGAICNLVSPKTKNHNNLHIGTIICYTFQFCLHNEKIGYIRVATGFNRLIRYGIENEHCWIVHYQYYSSYGVSFTQHTHSMKATSNNVGSKYSIKIDNKLQRSLLFRFLSILINFHRRSINIFCCNSSMNSFYMILQIKKMDNICKYDQ